MSKPFSSEQLEQVTGGSWTGAAPEKVTGFAFDARQLRSGEAFVALSCGARDGHEFIPQAHAAGAGAAIVEQPRPVPIPQLVVPDSLAAMAAIAGERRRAFNRPVVGITGSSGKTSTKEMLRCLLGEEQVHATAGNWNNRIGVPMTLFGLDPEVHAFGVIEAGINQPGEMVELGRMIRSDLSLLTNIGYAHLELLGSQEGIAAEKAKLAEEARPGSPIILPADALRYPAFAAMADRAVVLFGEEDPPPVAVRKAVGCRISPTSDPAWTEIRLGDCGDAAPYAVFTPSRGIARNAALALLAGLELGLSPALLRQRLLSWRPGATRGACRATARGLCYLDCYNANPDSMADALEAFGRVAPGELPRCYVLGAMNELGSRAAELHRQSLVKLRPRPEDRVFLVGPEALVRGYRQALKESGAQPEQIASAKKVEEIESAVADFQGALFLKGSRSYQLERLQPD